MSFTDQKPRKATERHITRWGGEEGSPRFRCYLCGHKFQLGDYWRWVSGHAVKLSNFLVCQECDSENVVDKWVAANKTAHKLFWWLYR